MVRRATVFAFTCLTSLGMVTLSGVIRTQAQAATSSTSIRHEDILVAQNSQNSANSPIPASSGTPSASVGNPILLAPGAQSSDVLLLQQQLQKLGYYNGPLDGSYGPSTQRAVQGFQQQATLPATGSLDQATWQQMQVPQLFSNPSAAATSPTGVVGTPPQTPGNSTSVVPSNPQPGTSSDSEPTPTPAPTATASASSTEPSKPATPTPTPTATLVNPTASPSAKSEPDAPVQAKGHKLWWAIAILSLLMISISIVLMVLLGWRRSQQQGQSELEDEAIFPPSQASLAVEQGQANGSATHAAVGPRSTNLDTLVSESSSDATLVPVTRMEETTRLSRVNITEALVADLVHQDASKRHKAIWELGQRGNSTAVQPLVDAMLDADSKEKSLILAALSEIGMRTLKPMNRALAVSLQDENPEVRKNAIRDLTRVYDQIGQISQMLGRALQDNDSEVQETAKWALDQLGRIRSLTGPPFPSGENPNPSHYLTDESSRPFRS